jgi:hypothetical protein
MRELFFSLLLLNFAFFAWAHWVDVPARATSGAALPALRLAASAANGAAAGAVALAPIRCRSIGPFADTAAETAAANVLSARGLKPQPRTAETQTPDGYWVYVDLKDAAARRRAIDRLNSAGLRDAAVVPQLDQGDRLSVGLFSAQRGAVRRAEQVRDLGFAPVLETHQHAVSEQWLDIALKAGDPDPRVEELTATGQSATAAAQSKKAAALKIDDCPAKSSSG